MVKILKTKMQIVEKDTKAQQNSGDGKKSSKYINK